MRCMSMINLQAVREAELHTDPFDFMVVPGFLSADVLARVNADYPAIESAANHALDNVQYGPAFAELMEEMRATEFATTLGDRFGDQDSSHVVCLSLPAPQSDRFDESSTARTDGDSPHLFGLRSGSWVTEASRSGR